MEVLITALYPPYVEGGVIFVSFMATAAFNGQILQISFRVQYQFGTTLAQKRTGIINAAAAAKSAYEQAHGLSLPAVASIEILGI